MPYCVLRAPAAIRHRLVQPSPFSVFLFAGGCQSNRTAGTRLWTREALCRKRIPIRRPVPLFPSCFECRALTSFHSRAGFRLHPRPLSSHPQRAQSPGSRCDQTCVPFVFVVRRFVNAFSELREAGRKNLPCYWGDPVQFMSVPANMGDCPFPGSGVIPSLTSEGLRWDWCCPHLPFRAPQW